MATVKAIVRTTRKKTEVNIRFRLSDGRGVQIFHSSGIMVNPELWDAKNDCIKKRALCPESKRNEIDKAVNERKSLLLDLYAAHKEQVMSGTSLDELIDREINSQKYNASSKNLFELIDIYIEENNRAENTKKADRDSKAGLLRYETFRRLTENKDFKLDVLSFNEELIDDIKSFYMNEGSLYQEYPLIFKKLQKVCNLNRSIKDKGENGTCSFMKRLKAFFSWCVKKKIIEVSPFSYYENTLTQRYGTPYYLTLEERNIIAEHDFSHNKRLSVQRDIFMFQCCIGCRISDLRSLTKNNIIGGAVEYIPIKTQGEHPQTVRVPLNDRAISLIKKYEGEKLGGLLFPYLSSCAYNRAIKEILTECGITRLVTVLNPTTGREEKKPINKIASSHMARRTFIGNLYKKVKDPNLVGALSGHCEGSKAFTRYREIDEDIKKELVSLID
jgi:integrase